MTRSAQHAMGAWQAGQRRRRADAVMNTIAEGALAAGGFVLVNATAGMGFGLPVGAAGISIGAGAVCAALGWMKHARRPRPVQQTSAAPARLYAVPAVRRAA